MNELSVKIFNLHSNGPREAKDFKVMAHEEYDQHGKLRTNRYVEYTIVGNNRSWTDFMSVRAFKKLNPTVPVEGLK